MLTQKEAVALVRKSAGESGLFRAVIGTELADAIVNGRLDDEDSLRLALTVATAMIDIPTN